MKKAIVYCRLAVADQESDTKLAEQKLDCLDYAERHNYHVLEVISEIGNGLNRQRQGLQKLLQLCERNGIEVVITQDMERLSRDYRHINSLIQTFVDAGIKLITLLPEPSQ